MNDIRGIKCPDCAASMPAINAKPKDGGVVQRQRKCPKCERKVVTVEKIIHYGDGRKRLPTG